MRIVTYSALCLTYSHSFFWGEQPKEGDHFTLTFKTPQAVKSVIVQTGNLAGLKGDSDYLQNGVLEGRFEDTPDDFSLLGHFRDKDLEVRNITPAQDQAMPMMHLEEREGERSLAGVREPTAKAK